MADRRNLFKGPDNPVQPRLISFEGVWSATKSHSTKRQEKEKLSWVKGNKNITLFYT